MCYKNRKIQELKHKVIWRHGSGFASRKMLYWSKLDRSRWPDLNLVWPCTWLWSFNSKCICLLSANTRQRSYCRGWTNIPRKTTGWFEVIILKIKCYRYIIGTAFQSPLSNCGIPTYVFNFPPQLVAILDRKGINVFPL